MDNDQLYGDVVQLRTGQLTNKDQNWLSRLGKDLLRRKSVSAILQASENSHQQLARTLTAWDLILIGIGGTIGTGLFVLTGLAASQFSGPAVVLSYIIAGCVASLAALCYSELASLIPVSGSCYSYTYHTLGEVVAFIIGWDLILEYCFGAATVAVGWSGYIVSFFQDAFNVQVDQSWVQPPIKVDPVTGSLVSSGAILNIPAMVSVVAASTLLVIGIKESARVNAIAVALKLLVIFVFLAAAIPHISKDNLSPFIPPNEGQFGKFGVSGVFQGATLVFFAYIGFDAVSTTSQECKNPQRDLPIGIMVSLLVCTTVYVLVSFVLTGVANYTLLNVPHPMAVAIDQIGIKWLAAIIEFGAVCGLSSVLIVELLGQSRVFYAMANDGLMPAIFAHIHPRFQTPYKTTICVGLVCTLLSGLFPIDVLGELTSVGTLFAFLLVCVGVTILRVKQPNLPRKFKVPGGPYLVPMLGASSCVMLLIAANHNSLIRFVIWLGVGLLYYAFFGYRQSKLRKQVDNISGDHVRKSSEIVDHSGSGDGDVEAIAMSNNVSQSTSDENLVHHHPRPYQPSHEYDL
ncbi:hypothetical protein MP228_000172 [Amoeboaphelidium protococcarum]|nr:hypothetical protein MP228_000172 [Amoeboaphelidium protococcarum]